MANRNTNNRVQTIKMSINVKNGVSFERILIIILLIYAIGKDAVLPYIS